MRPGTWVRWAVFLAVLGWAGYTIAGVGWSYFTVQELVDKALREASNRHRAAFTMGTQVAMDSLISSVRAAIMLGALHEGIPLQEGDVTVSVTSAGLSTTVRWSSPIVRYGGKDLLVVPMWTERSLIMAP